MTVAALPTQPSSFSIFRNRNFTLLWAGQLVSTIGDSLMSLAASIMVYRLTGSALSVGLMLMATAAPSIILGLFAGVLVDRMDRRRIMIAADLARAVLVLLIPILAPLNIGWLYVIVLLTSCVTQFFEPAHASVIPEVATDDELAAANSLLAISSFGSTAVGFATSGLLASAFSLDTAFYLDALSFLFSAGCIALLRLAASKSEAGSDAGTIVGNLKSGLKFLLANPILRSAFVLAPVIGVSFGLWNTLLLPFARQALGATEFEYGLQEGLTSVGFVAGSLLMARLSDRFHEGQWYALSLLTMGVVGIVYASLSSVPIAILFVMISGFANAPSAIARQLVIQRNTARSMRGRVNSVFFVSRDAAFLIGMGAAGLADIVGVREMVLVSAALVFVPGVLALVLPGLRQPRAEWARELTLLRAAQPLSPYATMRIASLADLDLLAAQMPALTGLTAEDRASLAAHSQVAEVDPGTTILHQGEARGSAFLVMDGKVVAGVKGSDGQYTVVETMQPGDVFGQVPGAAHHHHAADIVATERSRLLQMPATLLHRLVGHPALRELTHLTFLHHPMHLHLGELPRLGRSNQHALRELRRPVEKNDEDL